MPESIDSRIDVRDIDGEPFGDIVLALDDLDAEETLQIVAPFEPVPLYDELADRGFTHETTAEDGLYRVSVEDE